MATTQYPCIFNKVQLDANDAPIPGTMEPSSNQTILSACYQAVLPSYQVTVPAGHTRCMFPNGKRYFYLYNSATNQIVPNSLQVSNNTPTTWCNGQGFKVIEYIKYL